jgi:hypothetical protein
VDNRGSDGGAPGLHFTRLAADLSTLSETVLDPGPVFPTVLTNGSSAIGFAVAHIQTGWAVAVPSTSGNASLMSLDPTGTLRGSGEIALGYSPPPSAGFQPADYRIRLLPETLRLLSSGDGHRLLLTWIEENGIPVTAITNSAYALVLAEDGTSLGAKARLESVDTNTPLDGAPLDDGFEVATEVRYGSGSIDLSHIAFDGSVRQDARIGNSGAVGFYAPRLASSGSELVLIMNRTDLGQSGRFPSTTTLLQRVSPAGSLIGNATAIHAEPGYRILDEGLVSLGGDSVLRASKIDTCTYSEDLLRLDASGNPVMPQVPIVRSSRKAASLNGPTVISGMKMVTQGTDAVLAWIPPTAELARVRLAP